MVSTLKVQTIQIPNSDSDIITFDTSGNVTLNSNKTSTGFGITSPVGNTETYTSDNSAVTQNLVQSLVKGWVFGSSAAALNDSHNIASGTDNGTGDYTYAHTNNYNITTYANAGNVNTDARRCQYVRDIQTSSIRVRHWHEDGGYADCSQATIMAGDLA